MGTRKFSQVEEKDSRIKWEQADANTSQKLTSAINKYRHGSALEKFARISLLFLFAMLLVVVVVFFIMLINNYARLVFDISFVIYTICGAGVVFVLRFLIIQYIELKPYLHPEQQPNIWIFRATCSYVSLYHPRDNYACAYFQKAGGHIAIRITSYECKNKIPIGKEYIFYKFNDRTGNRWAAIPAEKLDEFS